MQLNTGDVAGESCHHAELANKGSNGNPESLVDGSLMEKVLQSCSLQMRNMQRSWEDSPEGKKMLQVRMSLPVFQEKERLLQAIAHNQVIIISGETGCGTERLLQAIAQNQIESARRAFCNVLCTQPRRIFAMAVAERISSERGGPLGESVGYKVRLQVECERKVQQLDSSYLEIACESYDCLKLAACIRWFRRYCFFWSWLATNERVMGTREVYEEKLRTGNLYHEPTIKPGLGTPRCPRCLSSLKSTSDKGEWTITPVLHDATSVAGCGIGGMLSAFYGLNTATREYHIFRSMSRDQNGFRNFRFSSGFLHCLCFLLPVLHLEGMGFQISLNSVLHLTMLLQVPHITVFH
ncbi:unnamed protein product [Lactuca virosa]|uniref:Uncharacterized protein n=1 Tax=Lactuca virosa TaxID=75947 RepID=A0AAU9PR39_9ASTR|nr:unnamed protein product [Lactuca virosa]